jgi:hypothetical protein
LCSSSLQRWGLVATTRTDHNNTSHQRQEDNCTTRNDHNNNSHQRLEDKCTTRTDHNNTSHSTIKQQCSKSNHNNCRLLTMSIDMLSDSVPFQSSKPVSILQCFGNDGSLDVLRYYEYLSYHRKRSQKSPEELDELLSNCWFDEGNENISIEKRNPPRIINLQKCVDGTIQELQPHQSFCYITYVVSPQIDNKKFEAILRRKFRCSFLCYTNLLELVTVDPMFHRWKNKKCSCQVIIFLNWALSVWYITISW